MLHSIHTCIISQLLSKLDDIFGVDFVFDDYMKEAHYVNVNIIKGTPLC